MNGHTVYSLKLYKKTVPLDKKKFYFYNVSECLIKVSKRPKKGKMTNEQIVRLNVKFFDLSLENQQYIIGLVEGLKHAQRHLQAPMEGLEAVSPGTEPEMRTKTTITAN
jgi:hypothetical protein